MILTFMFTMAWNLVSQDTLPREILSPDLGSWARIEYRNRSYRAVVSSGGETWETEVPFGGPGTDFLLTNDGLLVVFSPGTIGVYEKGQLKWQASTGKATPLVLGDFVALCSNEGGITIYHLGAKPMGTYKVLPPLDMGEPAIAGIWRDSLVIYGQTERHSAALDEKYPRAVAVCEGGVGVAFKSKVQFFGLDAKKRWEREFPASLSALAFGGGLLWVGGTDKALDTAHLWALDEEGNEKGHMTYTAKGEPPFIARIFSDGQVLRVFVSRVLYIYRAGR